VGLLSPLTFPLRALDDLRAIAASVGELPRLATTVEAVAADVHSLRQAVGLMPEDLRTVRTELAPLPHGIQRIEVGLDAVVADLAVLRDDVSVTRRSVEPMDNDLSAVESAVQALVPKIEELREHLDRLRDDLAGLPFVTKS
jgi:predicted  nucleic acid-binding Zn-ribbon protein